MPELCEIGGKMDQLCCVGTQTAGDCATRPWTGNQPCASPDIEEPGHAFSQTPTITGILPGLPSDLRKALSNAMPQRRNDGNAPADELRMARRVAGRN
ncbi:hypothetical protein [Salipiger sp. 1_MG-2023]|uniref:hypothetical protein n=1 Tax=Salipiger sp. 1_MG-2023 TaxID=3062665 RepID=UPI0026E1956E|nr:hypothetical protein [Salipiger sp. 1_MG-2023]